MPSATSRPPGGDGRQRRRAAIWREAALLLAGAAVLLGAGVAVARVLWPRQVLPSTALSAATEPVERALRDATAAYLEGLDLIVADATLDLAVDQVLARLSPQFPAEPFPVTIEVLRLEVANAFASAGGAIYVTAGLLTCLDSPEQLAAVVAHEIGHVVHRDVMRTMVRKLGLAALSAGLGQGGDQIVRQLLGELVNASFSKRMEQAADRYALDLLERGQLDPGEFAGAMRSLQEKSPEALPLLQYFQSHPHIDDRIALAESRSRARGGDQRVALEVAWPAVQKAAARHADRRLDVLLWRRSATPAAVGAGAVAGPSLSRPSPPSARSLPTPAPPR